MYLKSIEVVGFKSFPDKIDLVFPQGITCVVGPNGSGKSNISDAIRWVMGEQSAKTLRGGKMEDVIFSGTQKRKPLGFCEVSLLVDNSDKTLPIDFEEIMITRRIFRSGESEYYINKSSCRLKDIHELFMDTGLGKDGYSLVGQGRIEEIISGKPSERRSFFEEACGISKYRYKKDDAERKLDHTNDNILRVNDIIAELETQVGPLKVQSEKAKKYLVLRDELKVLEVNLWLNSIKALKEDINSVSETYENAKNELQSVKDNLENTDKEIEELTQKSKNLQDENDKLIQETHNQEYNIKTFENQIEISRNNILHKNQDIRRLNSEKSELVKKSENLSLFIKEIENKTKELLNKKNELSIEITAKTKELNDLIETITSNNSVIDNLKEDLVSKNQVLANFNAKKSAVSSLFESLQERLGSVNDVIIEKENRLNEVQNSIKEIEQTLDTLEISLKDFKEKINIIKENSDTKRNSLLIKNKSFNEANSIISVLKNKLDMLNDMENNFSAYPKSIKDVMTAKKEGELSSLNIHGTVASVIATEQKYAVAIDNALAAAVNFIICENENDAKGAINYLKKTKTGRVTFLPLSTVKPQQRLNSSIEKENGFIGIATDLVFCDKKYHSALESLLNKTAIFDTIDNAIAVTKKYSHSFKVVTLNGEIFNVGGSITGGGFKNNVGAISRISEIAQIKEKLEKAISDNKILQEEIEQLNNETSKINEQLENLTSKEKELNDTTIDLLSKLKYQKELEQSFTKDIESFYKENENDRNKLSESEKSIEEFNEKIDEIQEEISKIEEEISNNSSNFNEVILKKDEINSDISKIQMDISFIEKDITVEEDKVNSIKDQIAVNDNDIILKDNEIKESEEEILDINDEIEFRNSQIAALKDSILDFKGKIDSNKKEKEETENQFSKNQTASKELREKLIILQEENTRLELKNQKANSELETIINSLWESYELTITTAEELKKDIGKVSDANKHANDLKSQIRALGNINIDSIEEYKTVSERYEFLTTQRDDLEEAKTNLLKIIDEMLKLMKDIFGTQFQLISETFNETYVELFGGGRGELKLTDPSDILNSGIEIEVQPPGKKLTILSLLSGGEKAFTAIALLFSIIKIKPTPFCLFDEIEAALDDVNVYRFAEYLTKHKKSTQFIVITHRRGTMESADTLYGVTMQEKGVSKLLSLNIDEVEEITKDTK